MSRSAAVAAVLAGGIVGLVGSPGAAAPDADFSGDYLLLRRVTSDDGWFGLPTVDDTVNFVHEARTYAITTRGESADGGLALEISSRYFGEDPSMAAEPFEASYADGVLSAESAVPDVCLSTVTGEYDGPLEATLTSALELTESPVKGVFSGTFTYTAETEASKECEAENVGYTAEAWLISPDAALATPVAAVYSGQFVSDDQAWQTQYSVRDCEPGEGCDIVVRFEQAVTEADGSTSQQFIDVFMLESVDGSYVGGAVYTSGCASDLDGSFIADDVYEVRLSAAAAFFDIGDGERALVFDKEEEGKPTTAAAEVAVQCGPFVDRESFAGVPTGIVADWSPAAASKAG